MGGSLYQLKIEAFFLIFIIYTDIYKYTLFIVKSIHSSLYSKTKRIWHGTQFVVDLFMYIIHLCFWLILYTYSHLAENCFNVYKFYYFVLNDINNTKWIVLITSHNIILPVFNQYINTFYIFIIL